MGILGGALAALPPALRHHRGEAPALRTIAFRGPEASAPGPGAVDFAREIRPILSDNCFKCHGPDPGTREAGLRLDTSDGWTAGGESGRPALMPGDPDASELVRRIDSSDPDERMPPPESGKQLTEAQREALRRWVEAGAPWARHWSFEPPFRPALPDVSDPAWCVNEIDRFVLARLESEGLRPSPEADRATLIRRVTLDLTGLPPTPGEVEAFVSDDSFGSYERVVDRLLASPRFGERWARVWLDLARYADTKGYEKDARRTMWPYRDWVIRALNEDMPFDEFTIKQLAGDLLPNPTDDDILATAFHRNTMTNDEGGTDDEEFRVAAVKDRVNTTMSVWSGLTAACAECHTHKYDPLTQTEYYRLYAFFNQTRDADRDDEAPTRGFAPAEEHERLDEIREHIASIEAQIADVLSRALAEGTPASDATSSESSSPGEPRDVYWIDDDAPAGARQVGERGDAAWGWVSSLGHPARSGSRSLVRSAPDLSQIYAEGAPIPLVLHGGDRLVAHVWLAEDALPREIMLQIHTVRAGWEHRAYWGENLIAFGADGTAARRAMGPLPVPGAWARLEIAPDQIGLRPGDEIDGWAFTQHGGTVRWDAAGVVTRHAPDTRWEESLDEWIRVVRERGGGNLPADVRAAALEGEPSPARRELLARHYLRHFHRGTREQIRPLVESIGALRAEEMAIAAQLPRVPVMAELPPAERRVTRLMERGSFLSPAEEVTPGVPEVLHPFPAGAPLDRLGLARWLVSEDNPLTARVTVNRLWERFFGRGIVETLEDFGIQGAPPTHPELLDWLALRFIERGWSVKDLCRFIVTSAAYRQTSDASADALERDPSNTLLARGPRFRLEAEMIRDQALAVAGLLSDEMFGPPAFPPQPEGLWMVVYSGDSWTTSEGDDRYRRGLYTFWRRTSPYPSMVTFDAPSREVCTPRRIPTNTPLQALVTLNDPVYFEAAQALARRMIAEGGPIASERAAHGFRLCLAREPRPEEVDVVLALVADEHARYRDSPREAIIMATDPLGPLPEGADPAEAAAWTVAANVLLNLDEFLTRR